MNKSVDISTGVLEWAIIIVICLVGLGIAHNKSNNNGRNECYQTVFAEYPSVSLLNSTYQGYADGMAACGHQYRFWNF